MESTTTQEPKEEQVASPPDEFTPTERRILEMLSDGLRHTKEELHACLPDELASPNSVMSHVYNIRKKLNPKGHDIVCVIRAYDTFYQHVILLPKAGDGKH